MTIGITDPTFPGKITVRSRPIPHWTEDAVQEVERVVRRICTGVIARIEDQRCTRCYQSIHDHFPSQEGHLYCYFLSQRSDGEPSIARAWRQP